MLKNKMLKTVILGGLVIVVTMASFIMGVQYKEIKRLNATIQTLESDVRFLESPTSEQQESIELLTRGLWVESKEVVTNE